MHGKAGIVTKVTKGFCQQAKVAVPEELVGADGEVGIKEDFQEVGNPYQGTISLERTIIVAFQHEKKRVRLNSENPSDGRGWVSWIGDDSDVFGKRI
jgi:hypothetical protein